MIEQPHPMRWLVLFGVWLIYAAFGLIAMSLAPLVPDIEVSLKLSHTEMGAIMGAWQLMFIAAAIPCGIVLDRLGARWSLLLGALCIGLSSLGRSMAGDFTQLLAAMMVFGIGGPVISAGAPKVIASWFEGPSRGLAMGIYVTGPAIGAIFALTLTQPYFLPLFDGDWRPIPVLWAGVAAFAGVVWFVIASIPSIRGKYDHVEAEMHVPHRRVIRNLLETPAVRTVLWMSVGVFMISHGLMSWLPELLIRHGMSPASAGYWAALPTLVGILASLTIPRLAIPERRFAILFGLCLCVLLASGLLHFAYQPVLASGLVLQGMARATLMTVLVLTLVELPGIGQRHAGTASGLFFSAAELGGMLGPFCVGYLYDLTGGFDAALGMISMIAVVLLIGTRRLHRLAIVAKAQA